ncbi:MAG: LPS export ABC transporter permease LptG [Gammaproteobacteria bacterium]|jgi:lipopolysaccharide export system permease protein
MQLLDRYIAGSFAKGIVPVLILLVGLFSFLALSEELEDVGKGAFRAIDAIKVVILTMPRRTIDILPVATLLGALMGLGAMANHREVLAVRASGMSPRRISWPVAQVALLLIATVVVLQSLAIPQWERKAGQFRSKQYTEAAGGSRRFSTEFWTRSGNQLIRIGSVQFGRVPSEIEIYELDQNGRLDQLTQAERADILSPEEWLLHGVRQSQLREDRALERRLETLRWQSVLSEKQMSSLIQPAEALSPIDLFQYIRRLDSNGLNTHRYRFIFWQQMSLPLALIAMSLLAVPFVLGSVRSMSVGQRVAIGGSIGIVFYLAEQIVGNLALLNEFDPVLAAFGPDALLLVAALYALRRIR